MWRISIWLWTVKYIVDILVCLNDVGDFGMEIIYIIYI